MRRSKPTSPVERSLLAAALLCATVVAQTPVALTTPDGSRFLLCVDATMQQVHWSIASWTSIADDPLALPGLGRAALEAAQHGTWNTGSRDPERERQALTELDVAWQQLPARPDAQQQQRLQDCTAAAAALADASVLPRLLAALPVHRCELQHRDPVSVLLLTTIEPALPEVAAMLFDRREHQALRELPACWQQRSTPVILGLEAELLALSMPDHPFTRTAVARQMPSRDEALATWARTQHPSRTVHVLLGDFDVQRTSALLTTAFARTGLPATTVTLPPTTRPFAGLRRSQIAPVATPTVLIAWPLPPDPDRHTLEAARHWLAGGADSRLGQELQRAGRPKAVLTSRAPWPPAIGGNGLFVLEIVDPSGIDGLVELVLRTVQSALTAAPTEAALQATQAALQQQWRTTAGDARQLAAAIATAGLAWPRSEAAVTWPSQCNGLAVHALLRSTCLGQPAVVEGRP